MFIKIKDVLVDMREVKVIRMVGTEIQVVGDLLMCPNLSISFQNEKEAKKEFDRVCDQMKVK
ncbi:MAG: hypothetical protein DBY24_06005 [Prevotellaceae bacterium]|nr:MAG: hypothetical protein DBY24_06005 [Prevotellaceae bacterium]